jgi:hypothetical protein
VIDPTKEVNEMLRKFNARRLLAVGIAIGVLAAVAPATSLAANAGGGPGKPCPSVTR